MNVWNMAPPGLEVLTWGEPSEKPPILFVHGAWGSAIDFDELGTILATNGLYVLAMSLPGHGRSAGRESLRWHSINKYLLAIGDVITRLPTAPTLAGHSFGGYLAQIFASRYPEEVVGVILLAPVPPSGIARTSVRFLWEDPLSVIRAFARLSPIRLVNTLELAVARLFKIIKRWTLNNADRKVDAYAARSIMYTIRLLRTSRNRLSSVIFPI